jgi:hypothetical protein
MWPRGYAERRRRPASSLATCDCNERSTSEGRRERAAPHSSLGPGVPEGPSFNVTSASQGVIGFRRTGIGGLAYVISQRHN